MHPLLCGIILSKISAVKMFLWIKKEDYDKKKLFNENKMIFQTENEKNSLIEDCSPFWTKTVDFEQKMSM